MMLYLTIFTILLIVVMMCSLNLKVMTPMDMVICIMCVFALLLITLGVKPDKNDIEIISSAMR